MSKDAALFEWKYKGRYLETDAEDEIQEDNDLRWRIAKKHFFPQNNAHLTCATFHVSSNLLVAGFSNGLFGLYELPEFNQIHTLRQVRFRLRTPKQPFF